MAIERGLIVVVGPICGFKSGDLNINISNNYNLILRRRVKGTKPKLKGSTGIYIYIYIKYVFFWGGGLPIEASFDAGRGAPLKIVWVNAALYIDTCAFYLANTYSLFIISLKR